MSKYIDPIDIRNAVRAGEIEFYVEKGKIMCTDISCVVTVGEAME